MSVKKKGIKIYGYFIFLLFLLTQSIFPSAYTVPTSAQSVTSADLDLDGDFDIIVAHNYNFSTEWGGISILENNGVGQFSFKDSIYLCANQYNIYAYDMNEDDYPDIIASNYLLDEELAYISVLEYDNGHYIQNDFNYTYYSSGVSGFNLGDIDTDSDMDVVMYSNRDCFWAYMKNNGNGELSPSVVYDLDYYPNDIECGDLNCDGRDDVLVSRGTSFEVWFNYETELVHSTLIDSTAESYIKIADFDQDGNNDILASQWGMPGSLKKITLYTNDGAGNFQNTFSKIINEAISNIFITDLNNDCYPDIIFNVSYYFPNSDEELLHTYILFNDGNGIFPDDVVKYKTYNGVSDYTGSVESYASDLDGNGLKDIITVNYIGTDNNINILFQTEEHDFVHDSQTAIDNDYNVIGNFVLYQNYPNPFNPVTQIRFALAKTADVKLNVYNVNGQKLVELTNSAMNAGVHSVEFDGSKFNSGVYYYTLEAEGRIFTQKMILMK
ncbi:MAG: FG-GAP-like repeat-containing protein [Candidatus Delongbacteria bacterium]|jgi:hypothetical protein|nr:FG-GAP-like repeat-containing protein [Candidatus Delongbacteria bacterium]